MLDSLIHVSRRTGKRASDGGMMKKRVREVSTLPHIQLRIKPPSNPEHIHFARGGDGSRGNVHFYHFPLDDFKHFFTLFPKSFSSFLHSTCKLSVSCQYLAFDANYHRFRLQFQITRLYEAVPYNTATPADGALTHFGTPFQETGARKGNGYDTVNHNPPTRRLEVRFGHFPVHSPLLKESWLVPSPPLSDMLKFSG